MQSSNQSSSNGRWGRRKGGEGAGAGGSFENTPTTAANKVSTTPVDVDEAEKRRKRAERFGITGEKKAHGNSTGDAPGPERNSYYPSTEEQKKMTSLPSSSPAAAPSSSSWPESVCVVGAGPAGLGCLRGLLEAGVGNVCLIQESRGVGGKLCTKFVNGKEDPTLHFDMGVQLLRLLPGTPLHGALLGDGSNSSGDNSRQQGGTKEVAASLTDKKEGEKVKRNGGIVAPWPEQGRLKRLSFRPLEEEGRRVVGKKSSGGVAATAVVLDSEEDLDTSGYFVGVPSMSAVGRHLLQQCEVLASERELDLEVHIDTTAHLDPNATKEGRWRVRWDRGSPTAGQLRYRPELKEAAGKDLKGVRDFDAVVLAFEANKVIKGCQSGYKMTQAPALTPTVRSAAARVRTSQCWNLMLAFETPLRERLGFDAAFVTNHPTIAWIANDSSKPERAAAPECWMLFTTKDWADSEQRWDKKQVERILVAEFRELIGEFLLDAKGKKTEAGTGSSPKKLLVPEPCFVLSGRWGNNTEQGLGDPRVWGVRGKGGASSDGQQSSRREFPDRCFSEKSDDAPSSKATPSPPVWDADGGLGACGDWVQGPGVGDAFEAGLNLANAIKRRLPSDDSAERKDGCVAREGEGGVTAMESRDGVSGSRWKKSKGATSEKEKQVDKLIGA